MNKIRKNNILGLTFLFLSLTSILFLTSCDSLFKVAEETGDSINYWNYYNILKPSKIKLDDEYSVDNIDLSTFESASNYIISDIRYFKKEFELDTNDFADYTANNGVDFFEISSDEYLSYIEKYDPDLEKKIYEQQSLDEQIKNLRLRSLYNQVPKQNIDFCKNYYVGQKLLHLIDKEEVGLGNYLYFDGFDDFIVLGIRNRVRIMSCPGRNVNYFYGADLSVLFSEYNGDLKDSCVLYHDFDIEEESEGVYKYTHLQIALTIQKDK